MGSASPGAAPCPAFTEGRRLGRVENVALDEASGLTASVQTPGLLWSHNDTRDRAVLFALTYDGRDLGTYVVDGGDAAIDWEDIALGPGPEPGQWFLYVGDIGANNESRPHVTVYRLLEPKARPSQKPKQRKLEGAVALHLRYPDGISRDAETLLVDPETSDLYLVTKEQQGAPEVYRAPASSPPGAIVDLERVAGLALRTAARDMTGPLTGGEISRDGRRILLRDGTQAFLWSRRPGETVAQALVAAPCRLPLREERQGEAIAWAVSGLGFFTVSEGKRRPLYFYSELK